ncbi:5-hydroxytryptamine receptor 6 isoform X1 [Corapipo altera]|uniref:5-hydroxytryptamine receptor 6 isoform X1 n=1 Tax=Corapipo altera TaxID=415028 RepID=UPI000FD65B25|nr:5-hydroxytryptamine receptor 6 isoform X1 [Corapipo altera]
MEGDLGAPNSSMLGEHSLLVGSSWVAAFLCFIILLTTAGNFLLILLIITQRSLRNTSNYFLVSLFMSDLMVGLVVMPPATLNQLYGRWVLRGDFCSLWASFDVMCCSASILNLCIISLDRYLLIISPLKYKMRMTSCRALWLVLATWTVAALASFLPIKMGWHELEFEELSLNVTSWGDEDQCRLVVSLPYALVASCLTFFLPSAAISFTYCRILLAARKQAVQVASLTSNMATTTTADDTMPQIPCVPSQPMAGSESRRFTNKHSKKALKASLTLGILLGMFFVAWLPFFITNVMQAVCGCVPAGFFDVLTWLGYCNSTMNPIIYPLFMRDFKRAMGKFLPCCRRWGEPRPSAISFSMRNSNSGAHAATSLKNILTLQAETDSVDSGGLGNDPNLLPAPLTSHAPSISLWDAEPPDAEPQVGHLSTPVA